MTSRVASIIVTHVTCQGLGNPHQWAYKKGHSNEPLLAGSPMEWGWGTRLSPSESLLACEAAASEDN